MTLVGSSAIAGPPYQTDDPDPTETGGLEAYAFVEGDWDASFAGSAGIEANYGASQNVQISLGLPLEIASRPLKVSRGNVELSAKWRFLNDENHGLSVATFPGVALPTAKGASGIEVLLPLWGGWKQDNLAVFGGGGRVITSVPGGRNHWVVGFAATRQVGAMNFGVEVGHSGASERGGHGLDAAGVGMTAALGGPFALVARAGPARERGTGHVFVQTFFGLQGLWGPKK
ncbi:MAG: hypothetical protein HOP96_08055 [Sphingomonas sp.]|nr:hypothetical protein [Sphingomonas sp.]